MLGIACAGGVKVAVRLLRRRHDDQDAVDIGFEFWVGISLQDITGAFYGLVDVRVVEGESHHTESQVVVGVHLLPCLDEILVASGFLAFAEGERDGDFAGGFKPLSPEIVRDLDGSEGDGSDRIAFGGFLRAGGEGKHNRRRENDIMFHNLKK